MRTSVRFLSLLLVMLMLIALLAGCGGTTEETGDPQTDAPASEAPAQDTPEPAKEADTLPTGGSDISYPIDTDIEELSMWIGVPPFIYNNIDVTDYGSTALSFQLAEAATGIHIVTTALPTSTESEQYNIFIAAGDYCDIMSKSANFTGGADMAVEEGILLELSPYLETYAPDYYAEIMTDADYAKYVTTDEGNVVDLIGRSYNTGIGAIIRSDWLRDLGLDAPVTYDDYYEVLTAFKTEYDPEQPIAFLNGGIPNANSLTSGYGVDAYLGNMGNTYEESFYVVDGEVKYGLAEDGFKEYLAMVNKWYNEGLINPDFITYATTMNEDITASIAKGTAGIWYGGDDYFADDYKNLVADPNYEVIAITDPVKNKGDTLHTGNSTMTRGRPAGMMVTISAQSEHPEVALMYLNWYFTDEGIIAANYGQEDYTFEYSADGSIVITDVIAAPENLTVFAAKSIYSAWFVPFPEVQGRWRSIMSSDAQATVTDVWNSNRDNEWLYFGNLTAEEGEEFSVRYADINTLCLESTAKFITGEMDIETEFDTFVEKMYNNGLQTCIDIKQAAYDRYMQR